MGQTLNFNHCVISSAGNYYGFADIRPNSALSAKDIAFNHLGGVRAMIDSMMSDPAYEEDAHLRSMLQMIGLNVDIVMATLP